MGQPLHSEYSQAGGSAVELDALNANASRCQCPIGSLDIPVLLEALHNPAVILSSEYRILVANQAYRDRFNGGEKVCGRCCYEVAHGLHLPCDQLGGSCPLRRASQTGERARALHLHHAVDGDHQEMVSVRPLFGEQDETAAFLEILTPAHIESTHCHRNEHLVGAAEPFCRMLELVDRVAPTPTTALLLGETGTGKELVARALHAKSPRAKGPFVPVDCSGLSETLFESELFGHERGAFTGAARAKKGLVAAADGGTLFLDEVGDIPLTLQVKLLRLLESGAFRRVGCVEQAQSDFRLVCATHRDLRLMTAEGSFRSDLYYRISAFPIALPPLRQRADDIPLLVDALLERIACSHVTQVDPATLEALQAYDFPGNVRELYNIIERACLLAEDDTLRPEHLPRCCRDSQAHRPDLSTDDVVPLDEVESRYLKWALTHFPGGRGELASKLGLSERTLYRKLHYVRTKPGTWSQTADD